MAIGRLSVVVGARGKASPHAEYIAREGKYEKDESIEKLEATGHGNMPKWAEHEPNFFWKMSDNYERKNGTSYREHVISLPRELTVDQRHELIKNWITQEIGEQHAYQYAIHNPPALDGGEQPHAHIMFSERLRDGIDRDPDSYFKRYNSKNPDRGGSKKANTPKLAAERKKELKQQRDRWEKMCNTHLELAGSDAKISMKSLKAQNIKREPTNFTMSEIQDETIRKSYIDTLEAKKEVLSVIPSQDALVKEIKTQQDLKTDEFTQSLKDDYELERIELLVDEHYKQQEVQAEQERKALLAAQQKAVQAEQERKALLAAQQKAVQAEQERKALLAAQQKAAQAEQERKALLAAQQKAAQAEQERKALLAAQQKAAQAEQERKALLAAQAEQEARKRQLIEQRKPSEMLNKLGLRVRVVDLNRRGEISVTYSDNVTLISVNLHRLIKNGIAKDKQILISNTDGFNVQVNPEYAKNNTARAFERFMLQKNVLSDPQILIDFGLGKESLGIREFAVKYNIKYDLDDLRELNDMNPPTPVIEPVHNTGVNAALNTEQKPRVDHLYDNSLNYP